MKLIQVTKNNITLKLRVHDAEMISQHTTDTVANFLRNFDARVIDVDGVLVSDLVDSVNADSHLHGVTIRIADDEPLHNTAQWFKDAKPTPTNSDLATQMGCHFEEVAEMLSTLDEPSLAIQMFALANKYKQADTVPEFNQVQLLDDLCDQVVTATGVATLAGFDFLGAYAEVMRSNDSKRDADGEFQFDDNGKITKPPHYSSPELSEFV